jgi:hypothetical protein
MKYIELEDADHRGSTSQSGGSLPIFLMNLLSSSSGQIILA